MRRSELNVLRLGAIVAIKRDTVLFFPETGGKGEDSCSSRSFPTKFSDRFDKIYLYLYALRMLLARSKRFSRDIRNSCHIRVEQSAYPFIHLCSCTFHESRIVGNHRSVKVQRRKGLVGFEALRNQCFFSRIDRALEKLSIAFSYSNTAPDDQRTSHGLASQRYISCVAVLFYALCHWSLVGWKKEENPFCRTLTRVPRSSTSRNHGHG